MSVDQIVLDCPCGCGEIFKAERPSHISEAAFLQAWKDDANNDNGHAPVCGTCGCAQRTVDDGDPIGSGGNIELSNEAQPRIDSISAGDSGGTAGGSSVTVEGHAFSAATPTVKINGAEATNVNVVSDSQLTCDSPAGRLLADVATYYTKLAHGSVTGGPFQVGEQVTGATGVGTIRKVEAAYLMVEVTTPGFVDTETVTGGTSSATADLTADPVVTPFEASETATGQTSGATANVLGFSPLRFDGITGTFQEEEILGGTSGALCKLAATPLNGDVDVTVENANGQRATGAELAGAYEYTVS
jgi:hypothetical protein